MSGAHGEDGSEPAAERDGERDGERGTGPVARPARTARTRPAAARGRGRRRGPGVSRRLTAGLLAASAAVFLGGVVWSVPSTRNVLLESFTRQGSSFTELYFTAEPTFDGATVIVPVSLTDHGTGVSSYRMEVTLESPSGGAVATTTVDLAPRDGTPVPVVARLQATAEVSRVRVALVGRPQTLHFTFGQPKIDDPKG